MARLSPGRITALWVVLQSVMRLGDSAAEDEVISFARRSGLRCGGLPIRDGLELAVLGGFVTASDPIRLTELGKQVAIGRDEEDEPPEDIVRLIASTLILRHPPAWVAYWQGDPANLEFVLPDTTRQVLRDAKLVREPSVEDLEAWAWWDALRRVPTPDETAGSRKAIGDAAEEMSLNFERERLRADGLSDLAARVRCVARESAAYGFDVLSFCGTAYDTRSPRSALAIEVKGMALVARATAHFYITEHEWQTAVALGGRHVFHLWDGVHPGPQLRTHRSAPIVLAANTLGPHLPSAPECNGACRWQTCFLRVPISEIGESA